LFKNINKKKLIIFIVSIIIAGAITGFQYWHLLNKQEIKTTHVLVSTKKLEAGSRVNAEDFTAKEIPVSVYTKGMIQQGGDISNKYIKIALEEGNYVLEDMLEDRRVPIVEDGMRLVTIGASMTSALAGKVNAGDYVDIGCILESGPQLVEEKVQIYRVVNSKAVDFQEIEKNSNQYDSTERIPAAITLIASLDQAINIKHYETKGSLFLMGY